MGTKRILWQQLRRGEVEAAAKAEGIVFVPVGSIEQHGPHLPVGTDISCALAVAVRAAESVDEFPALVAPPIWWGLSSFHLIYPGVITLRAETMMELLVDLCTSIRHSGFRRIVVVNGHGGNTCVVETAAVKLGALGVPIAVVDYWKLIPEEMRELSETDFGAIGHAGEIETSMQLFLQPDCVDVTAITEDLAYVSDRMRGTWPLRGGFFSPNIQRDQRQGVHGDPTSASAEKGARLVELAASALARFAHEYRNLPLAEGPYAEG